LEELESEVDEATFLVVITVVIKHIKRRDWREVGREASREDIMLESNSPSSFLSPLSSFA
jgi:hypothetical protein